MATTTSHDVMPDRPGWWTVDETAAYMREHPITTRRRIRRGQLKAARLGRTYRVKGPDWPDQCLAALTTPVEVGR